jgi:hypothetical protein
LFSATYKKNDAPYCLSVIDKSDIVILNDR